MTFPVTAHRVLSWHTKIRLTIAGVSLHVPAGAVRSGAISDALRQAWTEFERGYCTGQLTKVAGVYTDQHLPQGVTIRIDRY